MSDKTNCPNCGAPVDRSRAKCPYCETPYTKPKPEGVTIKYEYKVMDAQSLLEKARSYIDLPGLTPNEIRKAVGLPEV